MILNFLNLSTFTHETADIKLGKFDGFEKIKIMVVRLDLTIESDKKLY